MPAQSFLTDSLLTDPVCVRFEFPGLSQQVFSLKIVSVAV